VPESRDGSGFQKKARCQAIIQCGPRRQDLHRHPPPQRFLPGFENYPHSTAPDLPPENKLTQTAIFWQLRGKGAIQLEGFLRKTGAQAGFEFSVLEQDVGKRTDGRRRWSHGQQGNNAMPDLETQCILGGANINPARLMAWIGYAKSIPGPDPGIRRLIGQVTGLIARVGQRPRSAPRVHSEPVAGVDNVVKALKGAPGPRVHRRS